MSVPAHGAPRALRALRWPALWIGGWAAMIAAVIAVCLLPAHDLPPVPSGFDKVEHFLTYAVLSGYGAMLFARWRPRWLAVAGLIALGIGVEFAQSALTDSRSGDSADAVANSLGALAGLLVAVTPLGDLLERIERRLLRKG